MGMTSRRGAIGRFFRNLTSGLTVGSRIGAYLAITILLTSMGVSSCKTVEREMTYKESVAKARSLVVNKTSRVRCLDHFVFADFPKGGLAISAQMVELACHEMALIKGVSYEDIVQTLNDHLVIVQLHGSDNFCKVSNINTCTVNVGDQPFSIIMVDGRFEDSLSALKHEVLHVLLNKSGVYGQQTHHLILRKYGLCGLMYSEDSRHLCGDITDEAVTILPN